MSCGLGRHFIINSPSFSLSIVPFLPPFLHPLWFNLSGGKGRVSMEMNMNVVIMCDWECTADGCQDNMGASHPSRLVDEQEKSAELQWCMGCAGREQGETSHLYLLPSLLLSCSLLQSHAHLQKGGLFFLSRCCDLSEAHQTLIHTLFFFSSFLFPKTTENNQGWTSDIHLYLHAQCCISLLQRVAVEAESKKSSFCISIYTFGVFQHVLLLAECTVCGVYLSSKLFTVYLVLSFVSIANTKE